MTQREYKRKRPTQPYARSENTGLKQGTTLVSMVSNLLENSQGKHKTAPQTVSELNLNCTSVFMAIFICHKPSAFALLYTYTLKITVQTGSNSSNIFLQLVACSVLFQNGMIADDRFSSRLPSASPGTVRQAFLGRKVFEWSVQELTCRVPFSVFWQQRRSDTPVMKTFCWNCRCRSTDSIDTA